MAVLVMLALLVGSGSASAKEFLAKSDFDPAYINVLIQESLSDAFGNGHGIKDNRLSSINATLAPMFATLPQNRQGRISLASMRYAVRRYFSEAHGWVVKGFDPPQSNSPIEDSYVANMSQKVHGSNIDHSQMPRYIEAVLQGSLSNGGFALADVAVVVATVEKLIFDKTHKAVEAAYDLRGIPTSSSLNRSSVASILTSYLILEHLNGDAKSVEQHLYDATHIGEYYPHWDDTLAFMTDVVGEFDFLRTHVTNPFAVATSGESFTFEDVSQISRIVSERFGPFSNHECIDVKEKLLEMDIHGTGRVKLSQFYASGMFLEGPKYLESLGSLDMSSPWHGPQVIISNYILGINNCITNGVYYDVCCLSECDGVFQHLESRISGHTASSAQIMKAVEEGITLTSHLSASAQTEARNLTATLRDRLTYIEEHHGGSIPLHGRLFAQWLHYAFPRECPYPHLTGSVKRFYTPGQHATEEEMRHHISSEEGKRGAATDAGWDMWIDDEEMLDISDVALSSPITSTLRGFAHLFVLGGIGALVLTHLVSLYGGLTRKAGNFEKVQKPGADVSYYI